MIQGITAVLVTRTQTGTDAFNAPIFQETLEEVRDVLVGQPTPEELRDSVELYGKRATYWLAVPKGDGHDWTDCEVILPAPFSGRFRSFGPPVSGIEANVPLRWNTKVRLERVEG